MCPSVKGDQNYQTSVTLATFEYTIIYQSDYPSIFEKQEANFFEKTETVETVVDSTTETTGRKLASANQPGATEDDNNCEEKEKTPDN